MVKLPAQNTLTNSIETDKWSAAAYIAVSIGACLGFLWPMQVEASQALAKKYSCVACHQPKIKVVGPSWQSIGERYGQGKATAEQLAASIKAGSSGKWGAMAMPAQNQISDADLQSLAQWVLDGAK